MKHNSKTKLSSTKIEQKYINDKEIINVFQIPLECDQPISQITEISIKKHQGISITNNY